MEELKVHSSRREHHRNTSKSRTNERTNDLLVSEIVEIRAKDSGGGGVGVNVNQQSENALNENQLLRNVDANVGHIQEVTIESNILDSTSVDKIHSGIIGYVDRDIHKGHRKPLSDPTASPAQRSTRSRSSLEKSPRSKRSKSESRRRRERKMIAAGELEVRQANETLMRYLRQCTEINDASLSGELEIDKNIEDRRVHRKTRSQRERRNVQLGKLNGSRERMSANGLTSILSDLVDDIIPNNGEIYNPFTPVISPTEGPPARIEKMFVQTSRNSYRSVDHDLYKKNSDHDIEGNM